MKIENLENDLKLVTYEGLEDQAEVAALVESEELKNARYDKFNLITSKLCARPTWSLVIGKNKRPRLFRLVKDALKKYKIDSENPDIDLISIEFSRNGKRLNSLKVTDSVDLNDYLEFSPTNVKESEKTVTWSSSDDTKATVSDGVVTILKTGDVTITATATEEISASILIKGTKTLEPMSVTVAKLATVNQTDGNTEASQANQNAITVTQDGNNVTVSANIESLNTFNSTAGKGEGKWIGLTVDTGSDYTQEDIYWNGTKIPANEFTEAKDLGASDNGTFIWWINAAANQTYTGIVNSDSTAETTITVTVVNVTE